MNTSEPSSSVVANSCMFWTSEPKLTFRSTPILHPKIDLNDLKPNDMLLSDEEIVKAKEILDRTAVTRLKRKGSDYNFPFPVIKINNHYYAIYFGKKKALGDGCQGTVKCAQDLDTKQWYAIKVSPIKSSASFVSTLQLQLEALQKLQNPFLGMLSIETRSKNYILYELAHGIELLDHYNHIVSHLDQHDSLLSETFTAILDLFRKLQIIHKQHLIHRDIKLENILLNQDSVSIIDFGFLMEEDKKAKFAVGTEAYCAPEIYGLDYHTAIDIYAAGICVGLLLNIFVTSYDRHHFHTTLPACFTPPQSLIHDDNLRCEFTPLLYRMIANDWRKRPSAEDIFNALREMQSKYASILAPQKQVFLVDISEILRCQHEFIQHLNKADKIYLCDINQQYSQYMRTRIARAFKCCNTNVWTEVISPVEKCDFRTGLLQAAQYVKDHTDYPNIQFHLITTQDITPTEEYHWLAVETINKEQEASYSLTLTSS